MLTLVDLPTKATHRFSLEGRGEITIRDFIIDVEDKLSAAVAETGKCVRVLSAAVGTSPINICDRRRTVHYYLLDAKPWYIRTSMFSSSLADMNIRETNEDGDIHATIKSVLKGESVKDLKLKFARMTCRLRLVDAIHLFFEQKELEDDRLLSDYTLSSGSVISCIYSGRKLNFGTPYIYVTQQDHNRDKIKGLHPKKDTSVAGVDPSPAWRRATPGMWLEGICMNQICPAYSKMVVMNQGFTNLDFITELHNCKCPICYTITTPIRCGFNMCSWRSVGEKKQICGAPQIVREDWKTVSKSQQYTICPDRTYWSSFKITSRRLDSVDFCILCMSDMVSDAVMTQCGHAFHGNCLRKTGSVCLQCFGRQSMTAHQQLFN